MLKRMTLHLARCHEHPDGSVDYGYEIVAPIDADGRIDVNAWQNARDRCRVRRFWAGAPDRLGRLVHRAGGPDGATWLIDYDAARTDDDEATYRLDVHRLAEGEYLTIVDEDGVARTFRVARVTAA